MKTPGEEKSAAWAWVVSAVESFAETNEASARDARRGHGDVRFIESTLADREIVARMHDARAAAWREVLARI